MRGEFYKMYYEDWDEGTECLTLELEGAFLRLCNLMYRRQVSVMVPHMPVLAGIWRCRPEKAKRFLRDLVAAKKIGQDTVTGTISNERVARELEARGIQSAAKAKAGRAGGISSGHVRSMRGVCDEHTESMRGVCDPHTESMRPACEQYVSNIRGVCDEHDPSMFSTYEAQDPPKPLKTNDPGEAPASEAAKQNEAIREEKSREEEKNRVEKKERKQDSCAVAVATRTGEPSGFDEFWNLFPKRDGNNPRKPAAEKFKTAIKQGATVAEILTGVQHYAADMLARNKVGTCFVPMAKAWLHQAVWLDYQRAAPPPKPEKMDRLDVRNPHNVGAAGSKVIAKFDAFLGPDPARSAALAIRDDTGGHAIALLPERAGVRCGNVHGGN